MLGRAVQVEPMKPVFKAPGTELLKLQYDETLSNLAFNVNLRRYSWELRRPGVEGQRQGIHSVGRARGRHGRRPSGGAVQVDPMKPTLA